MIIGGEPMPKKKTQTQAAGPSQGEVVRVFTSGLDFFSDQLLAELVEKQNDLGLDEASLRTIQTVIVGTKQRAHNATVDQIIKLL